MNWCCVRAVKGCDAAFIIWAIHAKGLLQCICHIETEVTLFDKGHLRRHKIISTIPCKIYDCGFAVSCNEKECEAMTGAGFIEVRNQLHGCRLDAVSGGMKSYLVRAGYNTNLLYKNTSILALWRRLDAGEIVTEGGIMKREEILGYPVLEQKELKEALMTALTQTEFAYSRFGERFKHIFSTKNFYSEAANNQWTNGFWTGQLWLAYECTGKREYAKAALKQTESFQYRIENQIETDTHDLGFLYSPSCVAAYKLTGDQRAKETAIIAADKLLERFHEKGQFLQAWGKLDEPGNYRLIIDCLLNLPLLYWASEVTQNPVYAQKAEAHVHTALKVLIRPDHSTYHTFYFNPETGEPLKGVTHQGYSTDSAWSRGQSWGIYGIALSYRYTKDTACLKLFEEVTDYFIRHLPQDLVPYWDFVFTDGSQEPRDSSASAIAACGMLEMAKYLPKEQAEHYIGIARRLMKALYKTCAAKEPQESDGLLLHGVYGRKTPYNDCIDHGIDECNLWGDYYYLEGLVRLDRSWNPYW